MTFREWGRQDRYRRECRRAGCGRLVTRTFKCRGCGKWVCHRCANNINAERTECTCANCRTKNVTPVT